MKKKIRLNESELLNIVEGCIRRKLMEGDSMEGSKRKPYEKFLRAAEKAKAMGDSELAKKLMKWASATINKGQEVLGKDPTAYKFGGDTPWVADAGPYALSEGKLDRIISESIRKVIK